MEYVRISDLQVGDVFIEDCYPEHYTVVEVRGNGVIGEEHKTKERIEFFGEPPYGPTLVLIRKASNG